MSTAEIPLTDKQAAHVAGLAAIITQKNGHIERLKAQLAEGAESPQVQSRIAREYKRGWDDAANRMMNLTQSIARDMSTLRADAFELILEGERREREKNRETA